MLRPLPTIFAAALLLSLALSSPRGQTADARSGDGLQTAQALDPNQAAYLAQNWDEAERQWFYYVDQGSRLLPYEVFLHLEQADSAALFRDSKNLLRFGFLPGKRSARNPDGLAIGMTRSGDALGLTCAACHTQGIAYGDAFLHIDGGQAMLDLQLFLRELEAALHATLEDESKLRRMAQGIHGEPLTTAATRETRTNITRLHSERKQDNHRNHTDIAYGYTRLDAFGAILNKALLLTAAGEDNRNEPNAPSSYPYLWDTPQHDYVEWNGAQSNSGVGALARNIGEVIGVFGEMETKPAKWLAWHDAGYPSSIKAANLRRIEKQIAKLRSPLWPAAFPAPERELVAHGADLYQRYCAACHAEIDRAAPGRLIKARMSTLDKIQTDPLLAENTLNRRGKSGVLQGRRRYYVAGAVLQAEEPAIYMLNNLMVGVLKNNPLQSLLAKRDARRLGHPDLIYPPKYVDGEIIASGEEVSDHALLAYKARPLNGVWSGAPYLHNGSVPNLYELLLPAEKRSKRFYLGVWEYDPIKVGYAQTARSGAFLFDARLPGNSNAGHEYGAGGDGLPPLTEEERRALLEYLKTL